MQPDTDKKIADHLRRQFGARVPDQYLKGRNLLQVHRRLLEHLGKHVGAEVTSEALEDVGGQRETARRVRELRVEFGYNVEHHRSGRSFVYVYDGSDPDVARAAWWRLLNNIRRDKKLAARDKALLALKARVGEKVHREDIQYVGNIQEVMRRVRELRGEHGWRISTGLNRGDLRPDEYVLENLEQLPLNERVDPKVFDEVLRRDSYTCQQCGWGKDDPQTQGRRYLEVHHKTQVVLGGKPTAENLVTLCNVCHDAIPVDRTPQPPTAT